MRHRLLSRLLFRLPAAAFRIAVAALLCGAPAFAHAWNNHTLLTWGALEGMPEIRQAQVKVESLNDFLAAEDAALTGVLDKAEAWAQTNVPTYPARPADIAWQAGGDAKTRQTRFLLAVRVNPEAPLPLYVQVRPGQKPASKELPWRAVTTLTASASTRDALYRQLSPGEMVLVNDVIATAANEPDYGMDIGLWEDNKTAYGKRYGFGPQPFGNPAVEYSSQAPFHMGFYHESPITYAAARFLKRTYPEARVHFFHALAQHAMQSGHPYWAWRFAGWALHYVGDLTQPYHATVLPGISLPNMLWINGLAVIGQPGKKDQAITLVSNRHLSVEHYQYFRVRDAMMQGRMDDPLMVALRDTGSDASHKVFAERSARDVVARESHDRATALDATLETGFPGKYTRDPSFELGAITDEVDLWKISRESPPESQAALEKLCADLMRNFGRHTRALVRSVQPSASK